ncbi:CvpA family protein [Bacillus sp. CGMCC 1.16541]|uniref:CvpA family protein n=1 Tax=Bacillus sp. CGMCC 1.16541 TaxID=2185143 RepID=UPI000D73F484|nr:CvpA family protein [Bacillus sp. CGMCC 1.16541]
MLDIILISLLLLGFFVGVKRGFILQLIHLISFVAAFLVAYTFNGDLAPRLRILIPFPEFDQQSVASFFVSSSYMEDAFYRMIAFAILFFATQIILRVVGSMLTSLAQLPILKQLNKWGGGILGFLEVYVIVFILLYIGAVLPVSDIQIPIQQSIVATNMVQNTPYLSAALEELWTQYGTASAYF